MINKDETIILNEHNKPEGGRMHCRVCNSTKGFYVWKYRRGCISSKWWDKITCANCGSYEKHNLYTGEILEQCIKGEIK